MHICVFTEDECRLCSTTTLNSLINKCILIFFPYHTFNFSNNKTYFNFQKISSKKVSPLPDTAIRIELNQIRDNTSFNEDSESENGSEKGSLKISEQLLAIMPPAGSKSSMRDR